MMHTAWRHCCLSNQGRRRSCRLESTCRVSEASSAERLHRRWCPRCDPRKEQTCELLLGTLTLLPWKGYTRHWMKDFRDELDVGQGQNLPDKQNKKGSLNSVSVEAIVSCYSLPGRIRIVDVEHCWWTGCKKVSLRWFRGEL